MSLVTAWVVFPLLLLGLTVGWGVLVQRAGGAPLPATLLPGLGLMAIGIVGAFGTRTAATSGLVVPVVCAGGVAGLLLLRGRRPAIDGWGAAAALVVFGAYAAPFVLSGELTFGGYVKLDDTASWLGITDRMLDHGPGLEGLAPSTYEAMLRFYVDSDYPVGAFIPFAVGSDLTGHDPAWLYQPTIAFVAGALGAVLYELAALLLRSSAARALAAAVAGQAALLYGYAAWGGLKEQEAALGVALGATLVSLLVRPGVGVRALVPLAVTAAGIIAATSVGGGLWAGPLLLAGLVVAVVQDGPARAARLALRFGVLVGALTLPALLTVGFLASDAASTITQADRLANLIRPLDLSQVAGVWLGGDFRVPADASALNAALIALTAALIAAGVVVAVRRRSPGLLTYAATVAVAVVVVRLFGSPWVEAKALAVATPAAILLAAGGAALLGSRLGRRVGAALFATVAGAVFASNWLQYREVSLAPQEALAELEAIGPLVDGHGPTLITEYEPFAARWFLREGDPEAASEYRRRQVRLRTGEVLRPGSSADVDAFAFDELAVYRSIVVRRSPLASRPPGPYERVFGGRVFEVWRRPADAALPVEHLALGDGRRGAIPPCDEVRRLAGVAGPGGTLSAARPGPAPIVVDLAGARRPQGWQTTSTATGAIVPDGGGRAAARISVPVETEWEATLVGQVPGRAVLRVDGRPIGTLTRAKAHDRQPHLIGTARLTRGVHLLTLDIDDGGLRPGGGIDPSPVGPLVIARPQRGPVDRVPAGRATELCGTELDWLEAYRAR